MTRSKALASALLGLAALVATARVEFKPLKIDPVHSRIGFTAATVLFDVHGQFKDYTVQVDGDPNQPEHAKVRVSIDAASIDTHIDTRDKHLRSPDFFEVEKYPKITFASQRIAREGATLNVSGSLDMHGHKKQVTIPFKVSKGKNGEGVDTTSFKGQLKIDRQEFGIGSASVTAKISLQDEVAIDLLLVTFL